MPGAIALLAKPVGAQTKAPELYEGDVSLVYELGAGTSKCPDEAQLRERAADAFGFKDPFARSGASASSHLRVEIARSAGEFIAAVKIVDDAGEVLRSSTEHHQDCDALVWALSHRMAMIIQRKPAPAPTAAPTQAPAAPNNPAPDVAPALPAKPAPAPAPITFAPACDERCTEARARRQGAASDEIPDLHLSLFGGALVNAGATADVGPGVWLGFAARHGWFSIGFEVRTTTPSKAVALDAAHSALAASLSGLVVPCARWRFVSACAFFEAGTYLFYDPSQSYAPADSLVSLGPRLAVELPLVADISARAFADLALHPYLPRFTARSSTGTDAVTGTWVSPVASGLFGLGLAWSR